MSETQAVSVGVVHDGLHVVSREEAGGGVHHPFEPSVLVLFDDIYDRSFLKRKLVLLVCGVIIHSHHWRATQQNVNKLIYFVPWQWLRFCYKSMGNFVSAIFR